MPDWKECEGQLLDGKYPLERYVGGDESSALFMIGFASAAVRIRLADAEQAAALLRRWNAVKLLRHPHLLEIDEAGATVMAGEPVAYVVMEHAEENLAEILEGRPLTPAETREMLLEVAGALDFLHSRGMAHGDLKAANILAIGNTVKLSSESVAEGDAAADIRALGFTLIHALTQQPEPVTPGGFAPTMDLPAPFTEIAKGCLHPDLTQRWTAGQVVARLQSREAAPPPLPAPPPPKAAKPVPVRTSSPTFRRVAAPVGLAIAGVAVLAAVMLRRPADPPPATLDPSPSAPAPVAPAPAPPPVTPPAPKAAEPAPARPTVQSDSTRDRLVIENGVVHRVLPNIPEKARKTIDGRPVVAVRVTVDPTGNVTAAAIERSFSPYFSKFTLQAARQWKFVPDEGAAPREWILRFAFTNTNTLVVVQRPDQSRDRKGSVARTP
jgi:eukaryotic-like serine/threonine-protein kinase